jgi:hypothetical protein
VEVADDRVVRSLYQRSVGYTYEAVKIFMPAGAKQPVYAPYREHVPPDTAAASLWLGNRRKDEWRDKQSHEHAGPGGGLVTLEALIMASLKKEWMRSPVDTDAAFDALGRKKPYARKAGRKE